jgi:hypothetical protein
MAKIMAKPSLYTYAHSIPVGSRRGASLSEKEESLCCQSTISTFSRSNYHLYTALRAVTASEFEQCYATSQVAASDFFEIESISSKPLE